MKLNEIVYSLNDTCNRIKDIVELRAITIVAVTSAGARHSNAVFSRAPWSTDCSSDKTTYNRHSVID